MTRELVASSALGGGRWSSYTTNFTKHRSCQWRVCVSVQPLGCSGIHHLTTHAYYLQERPYSLHAFKTQAQTHSGTKPWHCGIAPTDSTRPPPLRQQRAATTASASSLAHTHATWTSTKKTPHFCGSMRANAHRVTTSSATTSVQATHPVEDPGHVDYKRASKQGQDGE
jgi:hypothetical protein